MRARKELADQGWDHGPESVRSYLLRRGLPSPSRSTLARIFLRRGLVVPAPSKRPRSSWRRFAFASPNECWQLDASWWALADGTEVVFFQVLDDHSRRILASLAAPGETAQAAWTVVQSAIERAGLPQLFLTDNGIALNPTRRGYCGLLETRLRALGVRPISARPYHPQTLGKNERVHATTKRWLRARPRAGTLAELQAQLEQFDHDYNTVRAHQALAGRTPAEVWAATPAAPAPTPAPPAPAPPAAESTTVRHRRVSRNGDVYADGAAIRVGSEYIGSTLIVTASGDTVSLFTTDGTHVRTVTTTAGQTYYPTGQPCGGRRKPRRQSTMS